MNVSIKAVKFTMDDEQKKFAEQKMERIKYAEDLITDAMCQIKLEKKFMFDCTVNFRWGASAHVSTEDYDFTAGFNKLIDILDQKVKKEKDKIQEKN